MNINLFISFQRLIVLIAVVVALPSYMRKVPNVCIGRRRRLQSTVKVCVEVTDLHVY